MSPEQHENTSTILLSSARREEELDIRERALTCGHVVEQSAPQLLDRPVPGVRANPGVVSSAKTVEAADCMAEAKRKLDELVARAERELKKAEKVAAEARKKLAKLKSRTHRTSS